MPENRHAFRRDILVSESLYPMLRSHTVHGVPVLPMMLAHEWGLQAVLAASPGKYVLEMQNLKVLKGIQLHNYATSGDWFSVVCAPADAGMFQCAIKDAKGQPRYQMAFRLGEVPPVPSADDVTVFRDSLPPWDWDVDGLYDRHLFHGPHFQGIRRLDGISREGCAALFEMKAPWPDAPLVWRSDIPLLDSGIQLGFLWERRRSGLGVLPTGVESLTLFRSGIWGETVTCRLRQCTATGMKVVWDLLYATADGAPLALLRGLELHALANVTRNSP